MVSHCYAPHLWHTTSVLRCLSLSLLTNATNPKSVLQRKCLMFLGVWIFHIAFFSGVILGSTIPSELCCFLSLIRPECVETPSCVITAIPVWPSSPTHSKWYDITMNSLINSTFYYFISLSIIWWTFNSVLKCVFGEDGSAGVVGIHKSSQTFFYSHVCTIQISLPCRMTFPDIKLLQPREGLFALPVLRGFVCLKYLPFGTRARRDWEAGSNLQTCLARSARLKSRKLWNPNTPSSIGTHNLSRATSAVLGYYLVCSNKIATAVESLLISCWSK